MYGINIRILSYMRAITYICAYEKKDNTESPSKTEYFNAVNPKWAKEMYIRLHWKRGLGKLISSAEWNECKKKTRINYKRKRHVYLHTGLKREKKEEEEED